MQATTTKCVIVATTLFHTCAEVAPPLPPHGNCWQPKCGRWKSNHSIRRLATDVPFLTLNFFCARPRAISCVTADIVGIGSAHMIRLRIDQDKAFAEQRSCNKQTAANHLRTRLSSDQHRYQLHCWAWDRTIQLDVSAIATNDRRSSTTHLIAQNTLTPFAAAESTDATPFKIL